MSWFCQWSLMSLITGNKVKKNTMFEQKRFAGRHLLTFESQKLNYFGKKTGAGVLTLQCNSWSLSFDNNGLVKPSCGTVTLYGPFGFF
jgi:hypothetical protein